MSARPPASLFDALTSLKGAALLVPAILLVGATLAVGQSAPSLHADAPGRRREYGCARAGIAGRKPPPAPSPRPSARSSRPSSRISC